MNFADFDFSGKYSKLKLVPTWFYQFQEVHRREGEAACRGR